MRYCNCLNVSLVEHLLSNAFFVFLYLCSCIFLSMSLNLRSLLSWLSPSSPGFILTSLFPSLLKDPLGSSVPNLFSLPLSSSSNMSAHQAPLLPLLFYRIILAFRQQQTDELVCLLLSSFPPSSSYLLFSRSSGFEQAALSSQAHLLARANKTKATFPELNLLLRLSSVNWGFSSLKSGGVAGWLLAANLLTPLCVCVKPRHHFCCGQKGKKRQKMLGSLFVSTFGCREQRKNKKSRM